MRSCLGDQGKKRENEKNDRTRIRAAGNPKRGIVNTVLTGKVSVPTDWWATLHAPAFDAWTRVDGQANLCAAAARMFLTCLYSHRTRCTLQVSFTALQPFPACGSQVLTVVCPGKALSPCGQPDHPQPFATYQDPVHQRPNRRLITGIYRHRTCSLSLCFPLCILLCRVNAWAPRTYHLHLLLHIR